MDKKEKKPVKKKSVEKKSVEKKTRLNYTEILNNKNTENTENTIKKYLDEYYSNDFIKDILFLIIIIL